MVPKCPYCLYIEDIWTLILQTIVGTYIAISNSITSLPYDIKQVDGYKPTEEKKITELSLPLLVPIVIPDA